MRQKTYLAFLLFFLASFVTFFLHSFYTKTSVFADAKFYYSYTRSVVIDHNLLLGNELYDLGLLKEVPSNQFVPSFYPPGASIFWVPLFYTTLGFTKTVQLFRPNIASSGYEPVFEYSTALTNIFLGISALYLIFKLLSQHFSEKISLLTTTTLFLTTNLFFYIAIEPINSHAASFFISALFIYYFLTKQKEKHYYTILGVIVGVAGLVRTQDLLLISMPIIQIALDQYKSIKKLTTNYLLLTTGILLGFLPQILLWKYFFHTFWYSPYFDTGFNFLKPQILHVLLNAQNGLFTTTPIVFIAITGLVVQIIKSTNWKLNGKWKMPPAQTSRSENLLVRRRASWLGEVNGKYLYALFYFLLQLYLISSWNVYAQGGSYSIRMMVTTYPLLSFGLAGVIEKVVQKIGERKTISLISIFTLINFLSILNYLLKY